MENKDENNKLFAHHVSKLDGGESSLDDGPQAPKEVGCHGEPKFKKHTVTVLCSIFIVLFGTVSCHGS